MNEAYSTALIEYLRSICDRYVFDMSATIVTINTLRYNIDIATMTYV